MNRPRVALLFSLLLLALTGVAGCGGDDQRADRKPGTATSTERTAPGMERAPATTPQSTPAPSSTSQDPATAPAPRGEGDGRGRASPEGGSDSPQNDTPPPAGSPAERFEQDCKQRQKSCG